MTIERNERDMKCTDSADSKIIALWGDEELLTEAIKNLLVTKKEWVVIRISNEWDDETLARELKRQNLDILIVSEGILASNGTQLIKSVQDFPKLKIIMISLENNLLKIYNKQTICIEEASDLMSIIEVDPDMQGGTPQPTKKSNNQST